jgi:hypothetical protein
MEKLIFCYVCCFHRKNVILLFVIHRGIAFSKRQQMKHPREKRSYTQSLRRRRVIRLFVSRKLTRLSGPIIRKASFFPPMSAMYSEIIAPRPAPDVPCVDLEESKSMSSPINVRMPFATFPVNIQTPVATFAPATYAPVEPASVVVFSDLTDKIIDRVASSKMDPSTVHVKVIDVLNVCGELPVPCEFGRFKRIVGILRAQQTTCNTFLVLVLRRNYWDRDEEKKMNLKVSFVMLMSRLRKSMGVFVDYPGELDSDGLNKDNSAIHARAGGDDATVLLTTSYLNKRRIFATAISADNDIIAKDKQRVETLFTYVDGFTVETIVSCDMSLGLRDVYEDCGYGRIVAGPELMSEHEDCIAYVRAEMPK